MTRPYGESGWRCFLVLSSRLSSILCSGGCRQLVSLSVVVSLILVEPTQPFCNILEERLHEIAGILLSIAKSSACDFWDLVDL